MHLDSGTDVVLVEGTTSRSTQHGAHSSVIQAYNAKYDWDYKVAQCGELIVVQPSRVLAWRTAGWAGATASGALASASNFPSTPPTQGRLPRAPTIGVDCDVYRRIHHHECHPRSANA